MSPRNDHKEMNGEKKDEQYGPLNQEFTVRGFAITPVSCANTLYKRNSKPYNRFTRTTRKIPMGGIDAKCPE